MGLVRLPCGQFTRRVGASPAESTLLSTDAHICETSHKSPYQHQYPYNGFKPETMTAETTSTPNEPIVPISPPAKRIKTENKPTNETMDSSNGAAQQQELQAPPLLIKKLSDKARLPTRGSAFAAGYDLYAARDTTIPARGKALVDTDISMSVPAGTCKSIRFRHLRNAKKY